jgi:hypothetical protein
MVTSFPDVQLQQLIRAKGIEPDGLSAGQSTTSGENL